MSKEAMTLALDVLESVQQYMKTSEWYDSAITALREALAEHSMGCQCPACEKTLHASDCAVHNTPAYPVGECDCGAQPYPENFIDALKYDVARRDSEPAQQKPVNLRRGDLLRCIETDELCTVWATSPTGNTLIKWSANNFGNYTAEQIGELFWLEPEQEPVKVGRITDNIKGMVLRQEVMLYTDDYLPIGTALYTTPPQRTWVGLTNDEVNNLAAGCHLGNSVQDAIYKAVAKLKEKNT